MNDEKELHARVFQFPTSAIKFAGRKINYYDFLTQAKNEDCNAALKRFAPRINLKEIESFIDGTEGISDLQKKFYKAYISARYELITRPAYDLVTT
ncbi:MAG: hypothetical protein V8Q27_05165 [Eubacteriales bacterium]